MARRILFFICTALLVNPLLAAAGRGDTYASTHIDQRGKLHILLASGKDVLLQ